MNAQQAYALADKLEQKANRYDALATEAQTLAMLLDGATCSDMTQEQARARLRQIALILDPKSAL